MKNKWKMLRLGLVLFALPLTVTAAATAHQLMADSNPISFNVETSVAVDSAIGLAHLDPVPPVQIFDQTQPSPISYAVEAPTVNSGIGLARLHTVALNRNGAVEGRIASIEGANKGISSLKVFFVQNGEVISETSTQEDGSFIAYKVPEGAYSFVATGENGFAAYGVRVVSDPTGKLDNLMEAAAVSPNFASVKQIIKDKLPAEVTEQILSTVVSNEDRVVGSNRVRLNEGQLRGSVVALLGDRDSVEGTYVHIIQDNSKIAEVQADSSGSFMVLDLEPGVYDFVAAGPSGFAAVSFEAVQDELSVIDAEGSVADLIDTDELPVSIEPGTIEPGFVVADPITYQDAVLADIPYDAGFSNSLDVCLTCQQDAPFVGEQVFSGEIISDPIFESAPIFDEPIQYAGESVGCGCASGGCCGAESNFSNFSSCNTCNPAPVSSCCNTGGRGLGGRLFGGGGGNFGRLALLGAIGGIIAVAVDDDDAEGVTPTGE